jgi:hypothetical protein
MVVESPLIIEIDNNLPVIVTPANFPPLRAWQDVKRAKNTRKIRGFSISVACPNRLTETPIDRSQPIPPDQTFRLFTCVDNLNHLEFLEVYFP